MPARRSRLDASLLAPLVGRFQASELCASLRDASIYNARPDAGQRLGTWRHRSLRLARRIGYDRAAQTIEGELGDDE